MSVPGKGDVGKQGTQYRTDGFSQKIFLKNRIYLQSFSR